MKSKFALVQNRFILDSVFFLSGAAALIYQVCWQRLLGINYGVGPISTAIVVSLFMLGLGIGGLIGGRISSKAAGPVIVYILIEASIGIFGLLSLPLLGLIGRVTAGSDYSLMIVCVAGYLLVPTVLMGMTLPIVVRILHDLNPDGLENLSFFYFVNTIGAAFGAIFCSYILISFFGIDGAVYSAVFINFLLASIIYSVSKGRSLKGTPTPEQTAAVGFEDTVRQRLVLPLLFINGFLAIGYQIIWFRIIAVLLKDSAYSFSTTLACYLLGIGAGSYWLTMRQRKKRVMQVKLEHYLGLNVLVAFAAIIPILLVYYFSLHWPIKDLLTTGFQYRLMPFVDKVNDFSNFVPTQLLVLFWPFFILFASTFFMGAAFPAGLSLLGVHKKDSGSTIGLGYSVTVAGNTLGGVVCAFVLLPEFGSMNVLIIFGAIQISYLVLIAMKSGTNKIVALRNGAYLLLGIYCLSALPASAKFYEAIHPSSLYYRSKDLIASSTIAPEPKTYFREGVEGTVYTGEQGEKVRCYINGSPQGGRPGLDFVNEAIVGLSYSKAPRNVLLIGYGTGATLDGLLLDGRIEHITLVELNKTLLDNLSSIASVKAALENKRVKIVIDDGRRYLLRNREKFDVIAMEPPRSRSAFINNINSKEFFGLVKQNLKSDGIYILWDDDWTNRLDRGLAETMSFVVRYLHYLVGSDSVLSFSNEMYSKLLAKVDPLHSEEVARLYAPPIRDEKDIIRVTKNFEPATDLKPRLEYYLGDAFVK